MKKRWDLPALAVGVRHSSLQLQPVAADASESGEALFAASIRPTASGSM